MKKKYNPFVSPNQLCIYAESGSRIYAKVYVRYFKKTVLIGVYESPVISLKEQKPRKRRKVK